jgi:hypothetical protein
MTEGSDKFKGILGDERATLLYFPLARIFGFEGAAIIQQVHYLTVKSTNIRDGYAWYFHSVPDWVEDFGHASSERTIRRALKRLVDDGILVVENYNKLAFDKTRWYRLDREKLAEHLSKSGSETWKVLNDRCGQIGRMHAVSLTAPIHKKDKEKKEIPLSPAAPSISGGVVIPFPNNTTGDDMPLPSSKKVLVRRPRPESAAEAVAQVMAQSKAVAQARVVQAEAGKITKVNLQALLDAAMKQHLPGIPRMIVTEKALGVFKKRVAAAEVDLKGLVNYSILYWSQLASQSRAAWLKNPDKKGSPLPEAPVFMDFALRLPYFIAAYTNHLVRGNDAPSKAAVKTAKDEENARLRAEVERLKEQNEHLRTRRAPVVTRPAPRPVSRVMGRPTEHKAPPPRPAPKTDDVLSDDWTPPEWESNGTH